MSYDLERAARSFLDALEEAEGKIVEASEISGIHSSTIHHWRKKYPRFDREVLRIKLKYRKLISERSKEIKLRKRQEEKEKERLRRIHSTMYFKVKFLKNLEKWKGNIRKAALHGYVNIPTLTKWRKEDPEFDEMVLEIKEKYRRI